MQRNIIIQNRRKRGYFLYNIRPCPFIVLRRGNWKRDTWHQESKTIKVETDFARLDNTRREPFPYSEIQRSSESENSKDNFVKFGAN